MKKYINGFLIIMLMIAAVSCSNSARQDFSFAYLADTHVGTAIGADDLRASVNDINKMDSLDFVILAGDMTEHDFAGELDTAKAILDQLDIPYYVIPGNHELKWSASGGEKFRKLFGDDKFVFDHKGYRFIGINQGPLLRMGEGFVAREDLNWLKQVIKKTPKSKPYFVVTHYPIDHTVTNAYDMLEIVKQKNIQAICHGHGHANRLSDYSDVRGIMGRSNLSRGMAAGYNIVTFRNSKMIWRERQPRTDMILDAWTEIDITPFEYTDSHKELLPDMAVNTTYPQVEKAWEYDSQYSITAAPALVDDKVIFGNRSGKITALSQSTGSKIWEFATNGPIFTEPAIDSIYVVVTSTDSNIYCLDNRTGDLIWTYKAAAPFVAHPAIDDKLIYVGGSDSKFRCINLEDGTLKWDLMGIEEYVECKPLIAEDRVIFGSWDTRLYALHKKYGSLKWVWTGKRSGKLYSPAVVHPVYADGKVFVVAPDRVMTAIDIKDGKTIWSSDKYKVRENIGISKDGKTVYAKAMWDIVCALNTESDLAETKWDNDLGFGFEIDPSYPIENGDSVYFTTQFGFIYSLKTSDGSLNWIHRIGSNLLNTPVVTDKGLIVTGMDGKVSKVVF